MHQLWLRNTRTISYDADGYTMPQPWLRNTRTISCNYTADGN
jgi:hypothetical protein